MWRASYKRPHTYSMPTLLSARNPLLKDVRKAIARGTVTEEGLAVAESFHLLEEALRSDCEIPAVFAAESVRAAVESHVRGLKKTRIHVLPDDIFRGLSATEASQGVMALVRPPQWTRRSAISRPFAHRGAGWSAGPGQCWSGSARGRGIRRHRAWHS